MNIFDNAKWVWHNDCHTVNGYVNFFDTLKAEKGKTYKMHLSIDSNYALYINDRFVESGQFADYPEYKVYDTIDITDTLTEGENSIKIIGTWIGRDFFTYRKENAGLLYAVTEDDIVVLSSGEKTMAAPNACFNPDVPAVSGQLGWSFDYDVTKESITDGLKAADIQDKTASLFERPIKKLDIGEKKPAKIIAWGEIKDCGEWKNSGERMQNAYMSFRYNPSKRPLPFDAGYDFAATASDSEGIYVMIDLGEESVGYTDIDIEVPEECDIIIGHGEHLEDLRVRAYIGTRVFANRYHAKAGRNVFFNPFRRMGLRYLQLNIYAKSAKLYYGGIRPTRYIVDHTPYFRCSDHLHNKIYEISLNTLEHCMHEHYEDCPWREQSLYAMDSRNQMLCGYYCFGEYDFAKASLRLIGKSLRDKDNLTEICSPARGSITIPSFCAIFVTQVYEYVLHSCDLDFAREMLDVLKRITDGFASRRRENGLLTALPESDCWNFYEWQSGLSNGMHGVPNPDDLTYDAPINAFVSMAARSLAHICNMLGDTEEAKKYFLIHENLNAAIDREFWDEEKQLYYTYINVKTGAKSHIAQLTQALNVYCSACPEEKLDNVLENMAKCENMFEATLSHSIFVYDALMMRPEKYAKFVLNDIAEKWGHMLYNNATTFWETIGGADAFSNAGSLCHGWSAVPTYIYFRYAAGIRYHETIPAVYTIAPKDCGLYECEALIKTPNGQIKTTQK